MDRRTFLGSAVVGSVAAGLGACGHLPRGSAIPSKAREADLVAAANFGPKTAVSGRQGLAVTTHPLATQAAIDVLKEGGNAADAAATAALTQCVVEPHMTTLTGVYSISMPYSNGLYVDGMWICAAGVHYGSGLPKPGERINARILPHMFLKNGKPVLAGGSPSISLMENMVQNSTNILDFGLSIEEAVNKPRFGGSSMGKTGAMLWEANMPEAAAATIRNTGLQLNVVNP